MEPILKRRMSACPVDLRLLLLCILLPIFLSPLAFAQYDSSDEKLKFAGSEAELFQSIKALENYQFSLTAEAKQEEIEKDEQVTSEEDTLKDNVDAILKRETKLTWAQKLLLKGKIKEFHDIVQAIVQRLKLPGDYDNFEIYFSPNAIPNACVFVKTNKILLNVGILALANSVSELAFIIGHEMTHSNPEVLKTDLVIHSKIDEFVAKYPSLLKQREEIRADLGAMERLIQGKFDIWGGYNMFKSLGLWIKRYLGSRQSLPLRAFLEAHPQLEIRMELMKMYFAYKAQKLDMTTIVNPPGNEEIETHFKKIRSHAHLYSYLYWNGLSSRIATGIFGYAAFDAVYYAFMARSFTSQIIDFIYPYLTLENTLLGTLLLTTGTFGSYGVYKALRFLITSVPKLFSKSKSTHHEAIAIAQMQQDQVLVDAELHVPNAFLNFMEYLLNSFSINTVFKKENWSKDQLILVQQQQTLAFASAVEAAVNVARAEINSQVKMAFAQSLLVKLEMYTQSISTERYDFRALMESKNFRHNIIELFKISGVTENELLLFEKEFRIRRLQDCNHLRRITGLLLQQERYLGGIDPSDRETRLYIASLLWDEGYTIPAIELVKKDLPAILDDIVNHRWTTLLQADHKLLEQLLLDLRTTYFHDQAISKLVNRKEYQEFAQLITKRSQESIAMGMLLRVPIFHFGLDKAKSQKFKREFLMSVDDSDTHNLEIYIKNLRKTLLQTASTVTELMDRVLTEYINRGGDPNFYAKTLSDLIIENPQMIKSKKDLDLLFSTDIFWFKFSIYHSVPKVHSKTFDLMMKELNELAQKYPNVWSYDILRVDQLHKLALQKYTELGLLPQNYQEKMSLWLHLTSRGVSLASDKLLRELEQEAPIEQKKTLAQIALRDNRVWEADLRLKLVHFLIFDSTEFRTLKVTTNRDKRKRLLTTLIEKIQSLIPDKSYGFSETLELLAVEIESTREETIFIEAAKSKIGDNAKGEEIGLRTISSLFDEVLSWKKAEQWQFILFLRGEIATFPRLEQTFGWLGVDRIKRSYEIAELPVRVGLMDSFLDSDKGLLGAFNLNHGYGKTIIDHIFKTQNGSEAKIAREIIEAFLHALKETGNSAMRTVLISHLLAQPKSEYNAGEILKIIFESIGPIAIKVGQVLAISGILEDEHAKYLLDLQERSKLPSRIEMYQELEKLDPEFDQTDYGRIVGAASIKYAILSRNRVTKKRTVRKVFREEAINKSKMEALILGVMANYLVKSFGTKYVPLATILRSSEQAVKIELDANNEVQKGLVARQHIYSDNRQFFTPQERLVHPRLIEADYAEGINFKQVPEQNKETAAEIILRHESSQLFKISGVIRFDPDRHFGNYLIKIKGQDGVIRNIRIKPIDFGQVIESMTVTERTKILQLFALSQILANVGSNEGLAKKVLATLGSSAKGSVKDYEQALSSHFPATRPTPLANYFTLLAVIDHIEGFVDARAIDFVRAIINLKAYEKYAPQSRDWRLPSELFERYVKFYADEFTKDLNFSVQQKVQYAWKKQTGNWMEKAKGFFKDITNNLKSTKENTATSGAPSECEETLTRKGA